MRSRQRQYDRNERSHVLGAFNGDAAAMLLGDTFGQRQADSMASVALDDIGAAVEEIEHVRQVGRRDAYALVGYGDDCRRPHVLLPAGQAQGNLTAPWTALDRVGEQDVQHAGNPSRLPLNVQWSCVWRDRHPT